MPVRYAAAQQMGMDEGMVAKIHDFEQADLPERVKAALRFVEGWVIHNALTIDSAQIEGMRAHFTEAQIVELALYMILIDGMHKFNSVFDVPPLGDAVQVHSERMPAGMKEHLARLGFSLMGRERSFDPDAPATYYAVCTVKGDDLAGFTRQLAERAQEALGSAP